MYVNRALSPLDCSKINEIIRRIQSFRLSLKFLLNILKRLFGRTHAQGRDVDNERSLLLAGIVTPDRNYTDSLISYPIARWTSLIGREVEIHRLTRDLSKTKEESSLRFFALVGSPGIGKTAVADQVYKSLKKHFDCYAWVVATQNSKLGILQDIAKGFFKSLLFNVPKDFEKMNAFQLKSLIESCLRGKKYLLVIDDICHPWDDIKDAFSSKSQGRVLVTARYLSKSLESELNVTEIKRLLHQDGADKILLHERASQLLKPALADIESVVLKVFKGNPLKIATIGGMLSMIDEGGSEWKAIRTQLRKVDCLELCYKSLSLPLKKCFLYVALFPPYHKIPCKKLQRLWVAEGFVEPEYESVSVEEAARLQMKELINRNMLHVLRFGKDGNPKYCQLLRPLWELATKMFGTFQDPSSGNGGNLFSYTRHISLSPHTKDRELLDSDVCQVHCLLVFDQSIKRSLFKKSNWVLMFEVLRVLDLQDVPITALDGSIGNLVCLQYLGLRGTKLKKIPSSIKKLRKLQTLDIRYTPITSYICRLKELDNLRHLLFANSFSEKTVSLVTSSKNFENLRTLSGVLFTYQLGMGLKTSNQLEKLSVGKVKSENCKLLSESIQQMKSLRSLSIKCAFGEKIQLKLSDESPKTLQKLKIGGHVENLIDIVRKLTSLRVFYVWDCSLSHDTFKELQHLPNLALLSICNSWIGKEINIGEEGFPELKWLSILHCAEIREWVEMKEKAMPILEKLTIGYSPNLSNLPNCLRDHQKLRKLKIAGMPKTFVKQAHECGSNFSVMIRS